MPITGLQLITVTGKYLYLDGTAGVGTVTFVSETRLVNTAANEIVMPDSFTATLNLSGAFSIQIPATNDPDLTPQGFTYQVTENIVGAPVVSYAIQLAYDLPGATVDLADVSPVAPAGGTTSQYALVANTVTTNTVQTITAAKTLSAASGSSVPLISKGAVSQTADLQQWQNSSGAIYSRFSSLGELTVRPATGGASPVDAAAFFESRVAASLGLVVRGVASQTADLQQWQNSVGSVLANVTSGGRIESTVAVYGNTLEAGAGGNMNSHVNVIVTNAANKGITVRGASSQSANLQEWQNSLGSVLARVASDGTIWVGGTQLGAGGGGGGGAVSPLVLTSNTVSEVPLTVKAAASQTADLQQWQSSASVNLMRIEANGQISGVSGMYLESVTSGMQALRIKAKSTQTGDLTAWQISGGTTVSRVTSAGNIIVGNTELFAAADATSSKTVAVLSAGAADQKPLTVRGAVSQTANLQEWQDSASANKAFIDPSGRVHGFTFLANGFGTGVAYFGAQTNASTIGMVIQGAASQTANLQQWRNSASTVIASINNVGRFSCTFVEGFRMLDLGATDSAGTGFRTVRVSN